MIRKIISFIFMFLIVVGCTTKIEVESTKNWEGHYFNTKDFYNIVTNITLDKNESIWVLSNSTLNRLLNNIKK